MSVQYLIPAPVIEYIEQNGLYEEDGTSSVDVKGEVKRGEFWERIASYRSPKFIK